MMNNVTLVILILIEEESEFLMGQHLIALRLLHSPNKNFGYAMSEDDNLLFEIYSDRE